MNTDKFLQTAFIISIVTAISLPILYAIYNLIGR